MFWVALCVLGFWAFGLVGFWGLPVFKVSGFRVYGFGFRV